MMKQILIDILPYGTAIITFIVGRFSKSTIKKEQQSARMSELVTDEKQFELYEKQIRFFEEQLERQNKRFKLIIQDYESQIKGLQERMSAQKERHNREVAEMYQELTKLREALGIKKSNNSN